MSCRSTTTPSLAQIYCCLRREPSFLCSRLKWIEPELRVAEYSFTGIATSPNDTVSDAIDLAAIKIPSRCMQQVPALGACLPPRLGGKVPVITTRINTLQHSIST